MISGDVLTIFHWLWCDHLNDQFLEAVRSSEIELWDGTLSVMAPNEQAAHYFWDNRDRLLHTLGCQHLEIFIGEALFASSRDPLPEY